MASRVRTSTPASGREVRHRGLALLLLCSAQFTVILDTTIVNVALPAIRSEFGFASQAELQYVISLYALTFGGFLILAGRVADLYGRRRLFVAGLLLFAAASLLCGLAPASWVLLAGRALQGLASAMVSPAALSLLVTLFDEGPERNRALGVWGASGGAAGATGLIVGGVLTAALGWEWVFFINIPIGLAAALAARRLLPPGGAAGARSRLDLPGAVAVTLGLGLLIFGLTRGEQDGFDAPAPLVLLAASVLLLAAFVLIERHVRSPLVAFRLFRVPGVTGSNVAALLLTTIISSQLFFTTLYAQRVLGLSALETGLAFVPNSALVLVGSSVASRITGRLGAGRVLAAGLAIIGVGSLLLAGVSPDGAYATDVLPGFTVTGFGLGLAFVAVTIGATSGLREDDQGLASGVVNTAQQIGFAVGIAAVVAAALALTEHGGGDETERLVSGYSTGYLMDAGLAAAGALLALALVRARPAPPEDGRPAKGAEPTG
ncbi:MULTISPECIES: MFS transporter [Actinomadura]|uniref:MFS transporter n=1 Tax=Actinomadura yumaensis TaxID=111807 RepID=A0ABW2CLC1_9ACTN|nr:MFS transporter [Actinomadura sp. J1-007]MWK36833.1 MFS transporter [Actinomadura sp. J1-007]